MLYILIDAQNCEMYTHFDDFTFCSGVCWVSESLSRFGRRIHQIELVWSEIIYICAILGKEAHGRQHEESGDNASSTPWEEMKTYVLNSMEACKQATL